MISHSPFISAWLGSFLTFWRIFCASNLFLPGFYCLLQQHTYLHKQFPVLPRILNRKFIPPADILKHTFIFAVSGSERV